MFFIPLLEVIKYEQLCVKYRDMAFAIEMSNQQKEK